MPCGAYGINGTCTSHNDGKVALWVDGANIVPEAPHFTMNNDEKVYLKQGLYHCFSGNSNCPTTDIQTINHDCSGMSI